MNRINLVCLGVRNMERSLTFYKNIGFQTYVRENDPPVVFFDNQGSKLELYPIEELAKDIDAENPPVISPGGFCGVTLACNLKSEKEVDAFMEIVAQHGGADCQEACESILGRLQRLFSRSRRLLLGSCLCLFLAV